MPDDLQHTDLFLLDTVAKDIHQRAKQARPTLVWGLLYGTEDLVDVVYAVEHGQNTAPDAERSMITYTRIGEQVRVDTHPQYVVLGYYFSSFGREVTHHLELLSFPEHYYVVEIVQGGAKPVWNAARVVRTTGGRSVVHPKMGNDAVIQKRLKQVRAQARKNDQSVTEGAVEPAPVPEPSGRQGLVVRLVRWVKGLITGQKQPEATTAASAPGDPTIFSDDPLRMTMAPTVVARPAEQTALRTDPLPVREPAQPVQHPAPAPPHGTAPAIPALDMRRTPAPLPHRATAQPAPVHVNVGLSVRQQRIKRFCEERAITTLVHFTRLRNLDSILAAGLLTRNDLVASARTAAFNDTQRFDGFTNATCLSISFPNYKTFYFWRQHTTEPWVVLGLDAALLWELDCAFCTANAASNEVISVPITTRRHVSALEDMFGNVRERGRVIDRGQRGLPPNYPTHPQAEVLVFGPIPPRLIRHIWFEGSEQLSHYQVHATTRAWYSKMRVNEEYFRPRVDYRFW